QGERRTIMRAVGLWGGPKETIYYAEPPGFRRSTASGWADLDLFVGAPRETVLRLYSAGRMAWVGTDTAIHSWAGTNFGRGIALPAQSFYYADLVQDARGRLWLAVADTGLFWCDPTEGKWSRVNGLPEGGQNGIRCLLADREGNLWIGY